MKTLLVLTILAPLFTLPAHAEQKPAGWVSTCTPETVGHVCGTKQGDGFWPASYGTCIQWQGEPEVQCVYGG